MQTVVVTGASSGIGRACALKLVQAGFHVYAGVRQETDAASLLVEAPERLTPLFLDVGKAASIQAAAQRLTQELGATGLAGLVNNAGIGIAGPVECTPLEALRHQFEINVFGQIAVTQALLPLLRQGRGRIVNIGSIGDRIVVPFGGALCGSKSAFAALTHALRLELRASGMHVSLVEPASIATPAVDKVQADANALVDGMSPAHAHLYAHDLREFARRAMQRERNGSPPDVVGHAVLQALTARRPRARYLVGKDARMMASMSWLLPDRVLDAVRVKLFGLGQTQEAPGGGA